MSNELASSMYTVHKAEKALLSQIGLEHTTIMTIRFQEPMLYQLSYQSNTECYAQVLKLI